MVEAEEVAVEVVMVAAVVEVLVLQAVDMVLL